jgi:hypothetical protein
MRSGHRRSARAAVALFLLVLICGVPPAASGEPSDIDALVANLPLGFVGDFQWDNDRTLQKVAIRFRSVRRVDAEHAEALGCGHYDAAGTVTSIDVKMRVSLAGLEVEIWESAPDRATFTTNGSHVGRLSDDLGAIDAEWTTRSNGRRGRLRLRAAPGAQCAPVDAT